MYVDILLVLIHFSTIVLCRCARRKKHWVWYKKKRYTMLMIERVWMTSFEYWKIFLLIFSLIFDYLQGKINYWKFNSCFESMNAIQTHPTIAKLLIDEEHEHRLIVIQIEWNVLLQLWHKRTIFFHFILNSNHCAAASI